MAVEYLTGFEHGIVTGGPSFATNTTFDLHTGTLTSDTTQYVGGARSLYVNSSSANSYVRFYRAANNGEFVFQFRVRHDTSLLPDTFFRNYMFAYDSSGTAGYVAVGQYTTGANTYLRLRITNDNYSVNIQTSDYAMVANQWYRVSVKVDANQNPWSVTWAVDGTEVTTLTPAWASITSWDRVLLGNNLGSATNHKFWLDDFIMWNDLTQWVPPDIEIDGFSPNAAGTHNVANPSTTFYEHDGATPTALTPAGGGNAHLRVDDLPVLGSSDYVYATGTPTNTHYAELDFPATARTGTVYGVQTVETMRQATAGTSAITSKLYDGVTEATSLNALNLNSATEYAYRKIHATDPSGATWDIDAINALKYRWGYTADADPETRLYAVMLEAAFGATGSSSVALLPLLGAG